MAYVSKRIAIYLLLNNYKMLKQYETVFIATPVLSEQQMKEAVAKYTRLIKDNGGEVVYEEDWGLRQLAYPIQHKTSGFYYLIEFRADPEFVDVLETQYHRDERIIRFLTVALDKDAVAYAEHRRENRKKKAETPVEAAPVKVKAKLQDDDIDDEEEEANEDNA